MFKRWICKIDAAQTGKWFVLLTVLVIMLSACGANQTAPARDQVNQTAPPPNQNGSNSSPSQQPQESSKAPSNDSSTQSTNTSVQAVKPSGSSGEKAWDALQKLLSPVIGKVVLTGDFAVSANDEKMGGDYTMHTMIFQTEKPFDSDSANAIAKTLREQGYKDVSPFVSNDFVQISANPDDLIKNKATKVFIQVIQSTGVSDAPNELEALVFVRP